MSSFKILTYNVYYRTIVHQKFLDRVERDLNAIHKKYGYLDVIGFQENINNQDLQKINKLKDMTMVCCQVGRTNILTFLNPKIEVLGIAWDSYVYKSKRGRPFHIIVAKYEGQDFIFINSHFPHVEKKDLADVITRKLTRTLTNHHNGYIVPQTKKPDTRFDIKPSYVDGKFQGIHLNGKKIVTADISPLLKNKEFNVVMLGDFNDSNGKLNLFSGFRPFDTSTNDRLKTVDFDHLNLIQVACPKPPVSCCLKKNEKGNSSDFSGKYARTGDYIMVNNKLKIGIKNEIAISKYSKEPLTSAEKPFPAKEAASDHLPIFMAVNLKKKGKKSFLSTKSISSNYNCKEVEYIINKK